MHEKFDMIFVQSRKSAPTCKILHNDLHQWRKLLKDPSKRKKLLTDVLLVTFDEGLVVFHIQVQTLKPLFSTLSYPCGCCYRFSKNGETDRCDSELISTNISGKHTRQLGMILGLLNFLTER